MRCAIGIAADIIIDGVAAQDAVQVQLIDALLRESPVPENTLKISLPLRRFVRYELVYVGVEFRQAPHYNEGGRIFQRALLQCSYSCK